MPDDPLPPDEAEAVHEPPPGHAPEPPGEPPPAPEAPPRLRGILESLLFAADRPLALERLVELATPEEGQGPGKAAVQQALAALAEDLQQQGRGIELHQVAGGYQLRTAPQNAEFVQRLLQQKPVRLTRAQLETLAIVAYRQPITRPEIDDIRGVDSGAMLKTLLERALVRVLGKKEEPGRPILYGTTRDFLAFFNLRDLKDLPTLREFYELSEEHQEKVRALGLDDAEAEAAPGDSRPPPPPPLGRVELKDLNLGDDTEELAQIDEMIGAVQTEFAMDEVLARAGVSSAAAATSASTSTATATSGAAEPEREPEEL